MLIAEINTNSIQVIANLIVSIGLAIWFIIRGCKKEENVSTTIISSGTLLLSQDPVRKINVFFSINSSNAINSINSFNPICSGLTANNIPFYDCAQLIVGLILIFCGVYTYCSLKKRIYVLNMPGAMFKEILGTKAEQELKLKSYQVKEIILDTNLSKQNLQKLTNKTWNEEKGRIERYMESFSSKDGEKCFTGMAPIPFIIYAGTCSKGTSVQRFFEYKRAKDLYTELLKGRKGRRYDKLVELVESGVSVVSEVAGVSGEEGKASVISEESNVAKVPELSSSRDVLVTISTTAEIKTTVLDQFRNMKWYNLKKSNMRDNSIDSYEQLSDYVKTVSKLLEDLSSDGVKRIHLVCATQACFVFSLGEEFAHVKNRITEVISYHFISSEGVKYPFGIVVNGSRRGELLIWGEGDLSH